MEGIKAHSGKQADLPSGGLDCYKFNKCLFTTASFSFMI